MSVLRRLTFVEICCENKRVSLYIGRCFSFHFHSECVCQPTQSEYNYQILTVKSFQNVDENFKEISRLSTVFIKRTNPERILYYGIRHFYVFLFLFVSFRSNCFSAVLNCIYIYVTLKPFDILHRISRVNQEEEDKKERKTLFTEWSFVWIRFLCPCNIFAFEIGENFVTEPPRLKVYIHLPVSLLGLIGEL